MRHFGHLAPQSRSELFQQQPGEFSGSSPIRTLSAALGATLYSPATRTRLADDVLKQAARGVVSMVLCLEDAVADAEVGAAETHLVAQLTDLAHGAGSPGGEDVELPLLFIRVRHPDQIGTLLRRLGGAAGIVSGFVLPKFTESTGLPFLEALTAGEAACGRRLLAMPLLESPQLLYLESRAETLRGIARVVDKYRDRVLALRLGVTDFGSAYGIRRTPGMTVYDIQIVAAVIADVVNVLGRADDTGFTVTGPVWEYFTGRRQRQRYREGHGGREIHDGHTEPDTGSQQFGLLREIELDRANGLSGKTCIHPSHVGPVHALSVVSHEEFCDAADILRADRGGGVMRSAYANKMNEIKPHRAWAERTMLRAGVFGVAREDVTVARLLAAAG